MIHPDFTHLPSYSFFFGDNLSLLKSLPDESVALIYIDPPFNSGKVQKRVNAKAIAVDAEQSERVGFQGKNYVLEVSGENSYNDSFDDFLGFIRPRMEEAHRVLKPNGALYFHIDYREVHYCKVMLDEVFGRENFLNEIIWAYDYGAKTKSRWPVKHQNILYYVKDRDNYVFHQERCDRIPYMAPGLVTSEKAQAGKVPTDVWWLTIVSPTGKEKTGYPTQKPEKLLQRIIEVCTEEGDVVLDFFAGSGTTGAVAYKLKRKFIMADNNPEALEVIRKRLDACGCPAAYFDL